MFNKPLHYSSKTQKRKKQRHKFLLTFFKKPHKYESIEVNGFILVRQFNKGSNQWEVAIHSKEGWQRVLNWKQEYK